MADLDPPKGRQNFLGGFKLTLEHLGRPPVTRQYPEEKRPKQPRQHGRHVLNRAFAIGTVREATQAVIPQVGIRLWTRAEQEPSTPTEGGDR